MRGPMVSLEVVARALGKDARHARRLIHPRGARLPAPEESRPIRWSLAALALGTSPEDFKAIFAERFKGCGRIALDADGTEAFLADMVQLARSAWACAKVGAKPDPAIPPALVRSARAGVKTHKLCPQVGLGEIFGHWMSLQAIEELCLDYNGHNARGEPRQVILLEQCNESRKQSRDCRPARAIGGAAGRRSASAGG